MAEETGVRFTEAEKLIRALNIILYKIHKKQFTDDEIKAMLLQTKPYAKV